MNIFNHTQSKEYIKNAVKTEAKDYKEIGNRLNSKLMIRLLHGAIGIATESGELLDAIKKHVFYGKPLDKTNIMEEAGDLFWYIALVCDELGLDFETIMDQNIHKLSNRYPDKFTEDKALNRDLETERNILEEH